MRGWQERHWRGGGGGGGEGGVDQVSMAGHTVSVSTVQ